MHLLYLDDSGSPHNSNEEYFILGGLSIFEPQINYLVTELDKLAKDVNPGEPEKVEFHASEIFSRRKEPWKGMTTAEARGVIKSVLQIFANAYDTANAFACAVHKSDFAGQDPVELAFEDLTSRFDKYLERMRSSGDRQRGLIILDESSYETTLQNLAVNFRKLGTQWGNIRHIADIPFFVSSDASRIIQFADHIAYSVFRRYNAGDTQYFDIISRQFDQQDGVVHGLSHKTSNMNCMCLACSTRRILKT